MPKHCGAFKASPLIRLPFCRRLSKDKPTGSGKHKQNPRFSRKLAESNLSPLPGSHEAKQVTGMRRRLHSFVERPFMISLISLHLDLYIYKPMCVYIYIHNICIHAHICILCVCMCAYVFKYMYMYVYIYIYVCVYIYIYIYVGCMCAYIYVCVCVYLQTDTSVCMNLHKFA